MALQTQAIKAGDIVVVAHATRPELPGIITKVVADDGEICWTLEANGATGRWPHAGYAIEVMTDEMIDNFRHALVEDLKRWAIVVSGGGQMPRNVVRDLALYGEYTPGQRLFFEQHLTKSEAK